MISISQDSPTKDPTESKLLPYSDARISIAVLSILFIGFLVADYVIL